MNVICQCNLSMQQPGDTYVIEDGSDHSLNLRYPYIRNLRNNSTYAIGPYKDLELEMTKLNQQGKNK